MKIVHVCEFFFPWLGYQEYYLAREQMRRGHDVTVLCTNLRWPLGSERVSGDEQNRYLPTGPQTEMGIPTVRLRTHREFFGRPLVSGLGRWLRRLEPDVVHVHGYLNLLGLEVAIRRHGLGYPILVDEHQLPSQANKSPRRVKIRRTLAQVARFIVLPNARHFVGVAHGAAEWLQVEYGVPPDRIHYIPLGVDVEIFNPSEESRTSLRTALGIVDEQFVVVYSGKIVPYKRVDALLKAAVIAKERGVVVTLLLVGRADPTYLAELQEFARDHDVHVLYHQTVAPEKLAAFFNVADLCAWPADCTISHLEAAACGVPILIPDDPGIADRIAAGNGYAVKTGDIEGLSAVMIELANDPEMRKEVGGRGARLIAERYTWARIAEEFERLYQQ